MVSKNGERILDYLYSNSSKKPNINQISRELQISLGGTHKILKEFEKEGLVESEAIGNSIIYSLNKEHAQTRSFITKLEETRRTGEKKKTKIMCTIGPATSSPELITALIEQGMDAVRINGSHGTMASNLQLIQNVRRANPHLPILLDIPGKKIRLGDLVQEIPVQKNTTFVFTTNEHNTDLSKAFIPSADIQQQLRVGDRFLVDDGTIGFQVKESAGGEIFCKVLNDGILKSRKGLNFPDANFAADPISPRDIELIRFARENKLDFIGVSFAANREHLQRIKGILNDPDIKIIAKIENQQGLSHYAEIIDEAYGIMLDRGDLGSETSIELVPRLQKRVIRECNYAGKPIIIATQMLDSMVSRPYPTKAEISDVANAVLDGASALMLSAETAVGLFPLESVGMMTKIIANIEDQVRPQENDIPEDTFSDIVGNAIFHMSRSGKVDKILCLTEGGFSARMISKHKPKAPIIAVTSSPQAYRRLNLLWGVERMLLASSIDHSNSMTLKREVVLKAIQAGLLREDDTVIITGAVFPNKRKITNLIEIHKIHELLGYMGQKQNEVTLS